MTINLNEIITAAAKFGVLTLGFYLLTPATYTWAFAISIPICCIALFIVQLVRLAASDSWRHQTLYDLCTLLILLLALGWVVWFLIMVGVMFGWGFEENLLPKIFMVTLFMFISPITIEINIEQ